MMRNFMKGLSLVAMILSSGSSVQAHKPAYDGSPYLPATGSKTRSTISPLIA